MKKQIWILFFAALLLIGGTAWEVGRLETQQKLGKPGIKTTAIPNSPRRTLYLPEHVLDFDSVIVPPVDGLLLYLPHDTSFIQRRYTSANSNLMLMNIVLMGTDRTSIHKPQFCLVGSGWDIDSGESSAEVVRIQSPHPYDLPVMKLMTTRMIKYKGAQFPMRGIYVYWFVADHSLTSSHWTRMWRMAAHLLRTGELQRWAYVSCFAFCPPGAEDATYDRMKKFIAASVPDFQLAVPEGPHHPHPALTAAR
jgi:hypothetical protein